MARYMTNRANRTCMLVEAPSMSMAERSRLRAVGRTCKWHLAAVLIVL